MAVKANEVIKVMMNMGVMATINQPIDQDTAVLVVEELGHTAVARQGKRDRGRAAGDRCLARARRRVRRSSPSWVTSTTARPRCSTTSVAPRWRRAKRAASRSTSVRITSRRRRASSRSSIRRATRRSPRCVLAARRSRTSSCWSLRLTTASCRRPIEAIQHARAAEVPIVVAITKIDKGDADPEKVRNDLAKHNVLPEAWGGDTMFVNVSARTGAGHRRAARHHPAAGRRAGTESDASTASRPAS